MKMFRMGLAMATILLSFLVLYFFLASAVSLLFLWWIYYFIWPWGVLVVVEILILSSVFNYSQRNLRK